MVIDICVSYAAYSRGVYQWSRRTSNPTFVPLLVCFPGDSRYRRSPVSHYFTRSSFGNRIVVRTPTHSSTEPSTLFVFVSLLSCSSLSSIPSTLIEVAIYSSSYQLPGKSIQTPRTRERSFLSQLRLSTSSESIWREAGRAYVYRKSKEANHWTPIP